MAFGFLSQVQQTSPKCGLFATSNYPICKFNHKQLYTLCQTHSATYTTMFTIVNHNSKTATTATTVTRKPPSMMSTMSTTALIRMMVTPSGVFYFTFLYVSNHFLFSLGSITFISSTSTKTKMSISINNDDESCSRHVYISSRGFFFQTFFFSPH